MGEFNSINLSIARERRRIQFRWNWFPLLNWLFVFLCIYVYTFVSEIIAILQEIEMKQLQNGEL